MAQIFHRSVNVISRASIFGVFVFLLLALWIGDRAVRSDFMTSQRAVIDQPIPFSHEHHAGRLGIDCRYCHTSVETSPFAGLPPTKTCMNCHSEIWVGSPMLQDVRASWNQRKPIVWNRIHQLQDFAYFDHSIHVNKGVGCASCHGEVHRMPLTWKVNSLHMDWCLECHRQPELHLRPRSEIFNMDYHPPDNQRELGQKLMAEYRVKNALNCSDCHR